jgi:hypothetical protein
VIFNFCPSWAEVGFWTFDQLDWKCVLYSRQLVGELVLKEAEPKAKITLLTQLPLKAVIFKHF